MWGFVYALNEDDYEQLRIREGGYVEQHLMAIRRDVESDVLIPLEVRTFVGSASCELVCGPSGEYLDLIRRGAEQRAIPSDYLLTLIGAANHSDGGV